MTRYEELIARKTAEYGTKFSASDLDARFIAAFNSRERIKVEHFDETLTGTVGVTTGWKPVFLLMRTSRSMGSCETLGATHKIIAVKRGRNYVAA